MKTYQLLILLLLFFSCGNNVTKQDNIHANMDLNDSIAFRQELDKIFLQEINDQALTDSLLAHFLIETNSSSHDIALFFKYLLQANNETISENMSFYTFEILKRHETKRKEIHKYVSFLPFQQREQILANLVKLICLDLMANEYDLNKYTKDFTFLTDSICLETFNTCKDEFVE